MFNLSVENYKGEQLSLTNNPNYTVTHIDGLNPVGATINLSASATLDGSRFNSARVDTRNLVIEIVINKDIEANRLALYQHFQAKKQLRIYFSNDSRDVYIDGYVNAPIECDVFEQKQKAQISIICPNPYFIDTNTDNVNIDNVVNLFEFPFAIEEEGIPFSEIKMPATKTIANDGDADTGVIIELTAHDTVINPMIYRAENNEFFKVNITLNDGDVITIDTIGGEKSVKLQRGNTVTNIINYMEKGSTWFQLWHGDNTFICTADTLPEFLSCNVTFSNKYEGV